MNRNRLSAKTLVERFEISKQTLWRWYSKGDFPKPHYLSKNRRWFEDEVLEWEDRKMAETTKHHIKAFVEQTIKAKANTTPLCES